MPHFPALFALAHEPFICVDSEGRIVAVNQPAAQLLESTSAKLVGHAFADQVHPEDRERVATGVVRAGEDGTVVEQACRLRCAGASYRAAVLRYGREPSLGQIVIAVRELTDLDELRQQRDDARRRLAAVFETMHDIVFTTDEHGVLNGVNRVPPGLTVADTIGTPMLAFAAPEEQEPMRARYDEVRETGKLVSYETVAMYPDGRKENYSSRLGPIMDGDRSIGVVLITRNITQERQAEEAKRYAEQQLRDYMQQLERSNRELERFASVASHDLQEPLRKIQAFADRLRDKFEAELAETGRDYLERIRNAAKRMQDLINDLLMFSRISAKEQAYAKINLTKIAKSVLSDLEVRIEENEAEVKLGELPTIEADPVHMRQLLQNLIGNALKFTRPDVKPVVEVTAEPASAADRGPDDPEMVKIHVRDNGIGIEPRHHDRIFSIFERLHGRGKYEGTGVGLAVCRKIVEQHRGYIKVASVPGEGTTFTILLPVRQPERSQRT
ncbi:ATP-binding protein [Nannocystis sp. RBIL2]|uniref:sensor histidine kinase n=1 Tax=Nannocystis sp. RBIL2 TaxID=2996788 RepID=UPI00226F89E7|nr:ATP-binding protein [Nannocystis sp. RBIL2]MCY1065093.1 ATP-binding protein [Nannocystis sp. RBIL2]